MSEMLISVASRIAEWKPSPSWKLGLTAGKIGFLLLTWCFITRFAVPTDKPETLLLPNETLIWRLLMSSDVNVIALRGPIEAGLQEFLKDADGVSISELDEYDGSSDLYEIWPLQDGTNEGTILLLEGQCDDTTPFGTKMWLAYCIFLLLELYILNEFKPRDLLVMLALLAVIQSTMMIAVVANLAPEQKISLWVINN